MYAKIAMTTWNPDEPTKSCVAGTDGEYAFEFDHELGCPMYERMDRECECYVSRIRLVKTPVGKFIPTTERDFRPEVKFWQDRSDRLGRSNKVLGTLLVISAATGISTAVAFAIEAVIFG